MSTIEFILDLEKIDKDIFRGAALDTERQRTFGGQVAAQALEAATRTVDNERSVHSLHAYFLRGGRPYEPTVFVVDRLRDGRSFTTRQVRALQDGDVIFTMQASFHIRGDHGPEHSDVMRDVPDPETLPPGLSDDPDFAGWDVRVVPPEQYEHNKYTTSQQVVWFRSTNKLPDDERFHINTLAYMSDMTLLYSAMVPHPDHKVQAASLDHAMWFMRSFRADEWLLYDQISPSAHGARGLTHGRIFNREGDLVAFVVQEGLIRSLDPKR